MAKFCVINGKTNITKEEVKATPNLTIRSGGVIQWNGKDIPLDKIEGLKAFIKNSANKLKEEKKEKKLAESKKLYKPAMDTEAYRPGMLKFMNDRGTQLNWLPISTVLSLLNVGAELEHKVLNLLKRISKGEKFTFLQIRAVDTALKGNSSDKERRRLIKTLGANKAK